MIIGSPCPYVCDNKSPLSGYCNSTACINPQFNGSGTYVLKTCEYCNKATYMKEEETVCKYGTPIVYVKEKAGEVNGKSIL